MNDDQEKVIGAYVNLTPPKKGSNVWVAEQTKVIRSLPFGDKDGRKHFFWSKPPLKVEGYINTETWQFVALVTVIGITVGEVHGDIQKGVGIDINFFVITGEVKFDIQNGNELWVHWNFHISFDDAKRGDHKLISW